MNILTGMACIAMLLPTLAHAQKPAYVAYDGALLYDDADYLAGVVDTLWIGDTVTLLRREKRFAHVAVNDRTGWMLLANISERVPKAKSVRRLRSDSANTVAASALAGVASSAARHDKRDTLDSTSSSAGSTSPFARAGVASSAARHGERVPPDSTSMSDPAGVASSASRSDMRDLSDSASSSTPSGVAPSTMRQSESDSRGAIRRAGKKPATSSDPPQVQCSGTTKSGKQCSRKSTSGSSYCWQHGK